MSFEGLFTQYQVPILNYLFRLLGDSMLAQDLTQETFARAWKARGQLAQIENPRAWLYRIATNAARDHVRRQRRLAWLPLRGSDRAFEVAGPEDQALISVPMQRALLQLAPDYRIPLILYTCHELSVAEIATALGISVDAVKQRLVRARRQLREAYQ